jgi:hypothetical protein
VGYAFAVMNGEDNRHLETDGQKSYQARLTVDPLPGLELTGMVSRHNAATGTATREFLLASYKQPWYRVALQGILTQDTSLAASAVDGKILGGWLVVPIPGLPIPTDGVLRADYVTGDSKSMDAGKGYRWETIAGICVTPVKGVRLMLNNQNLDFHDGAGGFVANEDIVSLNTELTF